MAEEMSGRKPTFCCSKGTSCRSRHALHVKDRKTAPGAADAGLLPFAVLRVRARMTGEGRNQILRF